RGNLDAFARRRLVPSVTGSVAEASLQTTLLGNSYDLPVGFAPVGLTSLMRTDAESAGAAAAAAAGVPFALSTMGTTSIEDVAKAAPTGSKWFQLYLSRDRSTSLNLIERAAKAGFEALVLTVDTHVPGFRLRDERNKLSMPPRLTARTALQSARHPSWLKDLLTHDAPAMKNFGPQDGAIAEVVGSLFDPGLSLDDLAWLRTKWNGPIIVKGVLSPADATAFMDHGADGIWISNHGGRQLDRAISPIDVVGGIREAVGPDTPVILDSGIRSGVDVVTALAAGADFAFMGRAYMYGLMAGGEAGAARVLELVGREALNAMQLLGATSVSQLRSRGAELITELATPATARN
ncbi:alpha-hydroxy acid oxidase, partial [Galactobacter sp.]|uniref:alpha-hydroxy acid oxidase n=1 Tax=Galactobacter sp. TaxID=2676125 RepID=UPI0025C716F0